MTYQIEAIYDGGVLKPLEPIALTDQTRVKLIIEPESTAEPADRLAAQKAALKRLWDDIDRLPQHVNNDGWSVRQHDELLYGQP